MQVCGRRKHAVRTRPASSASVSVAANEDRSDVHLGLQAGQFPVRRLRLPANTAAQWFEELAADDNDKCICGRALGHAERQNILAMKERYLGTDVHSVLNSVKNQATQALREHEKDKDAALARLTLSCGSTMRSEKHKRDCATKLKAAERELAEHGNVEERRIANEAMELRPKVENLKELLKRLALPSGDESLQAAEALCKKLTDELTKTTKTVELNGKVKVLKGILSDASRRADSALRQDVKDKCNSRLEEILRNDPLRIGNIESSLNLEYQGGASMGQTLAVGYTFLVTLLNEGNLSFPLVVDSPAGPLDHSIRREVARIIPVMSDQFLAFTISTEREGFVATLAETVAASGSDQVQFFTLARLTDGTRPLFANAPADRTVRKFNSVLVHDRAFFESFNVETEEDEA